MKIMLRLILFFRIKIDLSLLLKSGIYWVVGYWSIITGQGLLLND